MIKVGDRVRVARALLIDDPDDQASDEFVGSFGFVEEVYAAGSVFNVAVHIDGTPGNELQAFNFEELAIVPELPDDVGE